MVHSCVTFTSTHLSCYFTSTFTHIIFASIKAMIRLNLNHTMCDSHQLQLFQMAYMPRGIHDLQIHTEPPFCAPRTPRERHTYSSPSISSSSSSPDDWFSLSSESDSGSGRGSSTIFMTMLETRRCLSSHVRSTSPLFLDCS